MRHQKTIFILLLFILSMSNLSLFAEASSDAAAVSGVPFGGIGAGKIEIAPDGRLGRITINNNPHRPLDAPLGCFAAVYISNSSGTFATKLFQDASDPHAVQSVKIEGGYPEMAAQYDDPALPFRVRLRAFTPLIPGDEQNACFPAAVFQFSIRNESQEKTTVALAMSWSNLLGVGGSPNNPIDESGECIHSVLKRGSLQGIGLQFQADSKEDRIRSAMGEYGLFVQEEKGAELSFLPLWEPEKTPQTFWNSFSGQGLFSEKKTSASQIVEGSRFRPAAAAAARKTLAPGEEAVIAFFLIWHTPELVGSDGSHYSAYYANQWSSMREVADVLGKRCPELLQSWEVWKRPFRQSSLPPSFVDRLFNGMGALAANAVFLKDGTFSLLTQDPDNPGYLGSPEELLAAFPFLLQLYPSLLQSELRLFAGARLEGGEIPISAGSLYSTIGKNEGSGGFLGRPDSAAAMIPMLYEYALWMDDAKFLEEMKPGIRESLLWLMQKDANGDAIPDGHSLWPGCGEGIASSFSADLWLQALRVGEEIAVGYGDLEMQSYCSELRKSAAQNMMSQLWNGRYFNAFFNPNQPLSAEGTALLPGAMPGTSGALRLGWKSPLGDDIVAQAMKTLAGRITSGAIADSNFSGKLSGVLSLFAKSFAPYSLARFGYPDAALRLLEAPDGGLHAYSDMGAWSLLLGWTGVSLNAPQQRLIVGPSIPSSMEEFISPFFTSQYSGVIRFNASNLSGLRQCELEFNKASENRAAVLKQIAFNPASSNDMGIDAMNVLYNGESVAGQDFASERLRIFTFQKPLKIQRGDRLTLLLPGGENVRILVDMENKKLYNLGAKCQWEKLSGPSSGFSFQVNNLLPERQQISFELINQGNKSNLLFANGKQASSPSSGFASFPVLLPPAAIREESLKKLEHVRWACGKVVQSLGPHDVREEIKKRLWDLQETVNRALSIDAAMRGVRVDVIPADSPNPSPNFTPPELKDNSYKEIDRAAEEAAKFYADLDRLCQDPVLASQLAGFFTPILYTASTGAISQVSVPFSVDVQILNPLKVPLLVNRIALNLPDGWSARTDDDLKLDDRESPQSKRSLRFSVTPTDSLWQKRFNLSAAFSGVWENLPFRREIAFPAGHDFIRQWLIVGPFPNPKGEGFNSILKPETNVKPKEEYEGIGKTVKWEAHEFPSGYVDFDSILKPNDNAMAYAYVGVYSPRQRQVRFEFGCGGDVKIFMNYRLLFQKRGLHKSQPSGEIRPTELFQGWNHLVVKVSESMGPWGFYFEIADPEGAPLPDLRYALDRAE
ncbi:MAG: GH116 family glycosyl-hydrolase [Candidatus Omnitrophota bacterium]